MALEDQSAGRSGPRHSKGGQDVERVLEVAAAADADGCHSPAWLGFRSGRLVEVSDGPPTTDRVPVERRPDLLAVPALINPHAHLDLTSVGPISMDRGFDGWLAEVRDRRPRTDEACIAAVEDGIDASLRGGVVGVGDIVGARAAAAIETLRRGPIASIAFIECLGTGRREDAGLAMVEAALELSRASGGSTEVGISPHAPYSCSPKVYEAAVATSLPITTHVAESVEELAFCRDGEGPLVDLLRRVGALTGTDQLEIPGRHPIPSLPRPGRHPWVLAHGNLLGRREEEIGEVLQWLVETKATVVYCPRATRFLGHLDRAGTEHPFRRLREAGVRVALGTDGVPCLDRADRITPLDDIRALIDDPAELPDLLAMATVAGAEALGWNGESLRFRSGCEAGLLGIRLGTGDLLTGLRGADGGIEWLTPPSPEALRTRG